MTPQRVHTRSASRPRRGVRRRVAVLGGAIVLLVLGFVVLPWLMWAAQINRAAALIEQGTSWPAERASDTLPTVSDPQRLDAALAALDKAQTWRPDDAHAYRLRGQIALATGRWDDAETALAEAGRRAPANPLIAWELALAYEQGHPLDWTAADHDGADELRRHWQQAGLTVDQFIARGDEAQAGKRPDEALRWYRRASLFAPEASIPWYYAGLIYTGQGRHEQAAQAYGQAIALQPDLRQAWDAVVVQAESLFGQRAWPAAHAFYQQALQAPGRPTDFQFRAALAGGSANAAPRDLLASLGVPVHTVATTTIIEGETMHWLAATTRAITDGTKLEDYPQNGARAGALWWSGEAAAVIDVPAGAYTLTVRAAGTPGAAASLAVHIDGVEVDAFATASDGTYGQRQIALDLAGGTHVVTVWFLNNGMVNGVDNNAYIDWVRIAR